MPYRVLLVDDQEFIRGVLRRCADEHPALFVCPDEAATGQEAIDLAVEHRPDAVILDNEMPGMTGLEAIPAIRRLLPDRVIVMYSATEAPSAEAQAVGAGADAYFQKGTRKPHEVLAYVAERLSG